MTLPLLVGVCTFRRPFLIETVRSLAAQSRRPDRVIIIDNDDQSTAEKIVDAARDETGLDLFYRHVPGRNIALARNAILDAAGDARLAMLDDDEIADAEWLAQLEIAMSKGADAVFGPSIAVYPENAPDWMGHLSPHSQWPPQKGGRLTSGHTANVLMDTTAPVLANRRFDPAYGRRGGSDAVFFEAALREGARFHLVADARVYEPVIAQRLSTRWLYRRRIKAGITIGLSTPGRRSRRAVLAMGKSAYCFGRAALAIGDPVARHRHGLRGALHVGVLRGTLGLSGADYYGKAPV
ncbi:succinoglycan biosynthesis protein exoM [Parvularcula bermudensis HTCC2503]|uniref:Succinoglycan biosynthesis protein exoM n=1 Tax=Parvularcula bermudensis (strain ATCC BAA-594 / HTCC2503 / KCTC 12087) TaxID=314260 RepID=E0TBS0_PARBH|nr:glycosyltransferase family 2 protein [Parvularcula bermudensis]ADM08413.1 succinoglycan biosynthesis protein exoM [Parvularcula bermudensis HTCC2503]